MPERRSSGSDCRESGAPGETPDRCKFSFHAASSAYGRQIDSEGPYNLLENAAKYSDDEQPIFISAEAKGSLLVTSVADRGNGIDDFDKSLIFDKFYRGPGQRYRMQGTGMGLAIVKAIVDPHGGKVEVTSQLGLGSVFSFSLPTT